MNMYNSTRVVHVTCMKVLYLRLDSTRLLTTTERAELDEDCRIFDNRAQGADQPREVGEEVLLLRRVKEDLLELVINPY